MKDQLIIMKPTGGIRCNLRVECCNCGYEHVRRLCVNIYTNRIEELEEAEKTLQKKVNKPYTCPTCKTIQEYKNQPS